MELDPFEFPKKSKATVSNFNCYGKDLAQSECGEIKTVIDENIGTFLFQRHFLQRFVN
jgi:hypothetical protein